MKQIFTICTGRCGQVTLSHYFNSFADNCYADVEPPELIYKDHWPMGGIIRKFQRKFICTDEILGRGKAFQWHDNNENEKMEKLVSKRMKLVEKLKCKTYIELSKFFIRSYCDATYRYNNHISILKLSRNPLANAQSFCNRNKNYSLDGLMPYFKKSILKIDLEKLNKFQLYLWQWAEIELRALEFIEKNKIKRFYSLKTEDIHNPKKLKNLFDYFELTTKSPIKVLKTKNTNIERGLPKTLITNDGKKFFKQFIDMIPKKELNQISHIEHYL